MTKTKWIYYGIVFALLMVLISSINHIAFTYNSIETFAMEGVSTTPLEQKDIGILAIIAAIGFECAMLFTGYAMAERRRENEDVGDLRGFLWFFAFINFFCNLYFALSVNTKIPNLKLQDILNIDYFILFKHALLAGSLPVVVLSLMEILTIFHRKLKREEKKELDQKKKAEKSLAFVQAPRASFDDRGPVERSTPLSSTPVDTVQVSDEDVKKNPRVKREAEPTQQPQEDQLREVILPLKDAGTIKVNLNAVEHLEPLNYEIEAPIVREPEIFTVDVFNANRRRIPLRK